MTGRLGLKVALDAAAFESTHGQEPINNDFELRALRFYTTCDFTWLFPIYCKLNLGTVNQEFYLHEAYVRLQLFY